MKLSDYVWKFLADKGIRHVFLLTGGGAMHLNDSLGQEKRIHYVCCHHEQACAMAAEGYARISGKIGVVNVTTGPGGINALNGVFGAWTDSIPMLVISGQVKRETCMHFYPDLNLRQLGDQEADILSMVKGITKYAAVVETPESIRYHLEKALSLATEGRPGPCWLDIPSDVQAADIDIDALESYVSSLRSEQTQLVELYCRILYMIQRSQRPVMMGGSGVRIAGAVDVFQRIVKKLGIPVVTAWTHDLITSDSKFFCGRPGTIGTRAGNFTVQNADFLLVIGSRLNVRQTGYNWDSFAKCAEVVQVDIDGEEMQKPTVRPDLAIISDAKTFLEGLEKCIDTQQYVTPDGHMLWLEWCQERLKRYPVLLPEQMDIQQDLLNPYYFMKTLFECLRDDDIIVTANAAACIVSFQVGELREEQRLFSNSGSASMGYDLPAAIGAAFAGAGKRVICLAGDGSVQLNIQELQTIRYHKLPVKVFVLNNGGYLSIRSTQRNFFGRLVGESPVSGVSFPDYTVVANAYGLPSGYVQGVDFKTQILEALDLDGPSLYEVMLDPTQGFEPRMSSRQLPNGTIVSPELDDMYPFLSRDELNENRLCSENREE